jgi:hypothetical protein
LEFNVIYKISEHTFMITTKRNSVKLLSAKEIHILKSKIYWAVKDLSTASLYTILAIINRQLYQLCVNSGAAIPGSKEFDHDRLQQLAFTSLDGFAEVSIPTKYLYENYIPTYWEQAATSNKTVIKIRDLMGDIYKSDLERDEDGIPLDKKNRIMVLNEDCNPDTGEFEEKVTCGFGIYKLVKPAPGTTVEYTRYEQYNIAKALVTWRTIYRLLESRYNAKYNYDPAISFYDQLPSHKGNFVRNLWNAFMLGVEDFEGNIYTDGEIDFVFQYPDSLVERIPSTFVHTWKEGCTLLKEAWDAMQKWGRAIPSWRKQNPYPEAEVREWEFAVVDF